MAEASVAPAQPALSADDRADIAILLGEVPTLNDELAEQDVLQKQNDLELENQRLRFEAAKEALRQLEQSGSYSREQYQQAVNAVHQSELRYLTVQLQQEHLKSRQPTLRHLVDVVTFALHMVELIDPTAVAAIAPRRAPPAPEVPEPAPEALPAQPVPEASALSVIEAQEEERDWIARQLHNGPAQTLTNLILRAEICERLAETDTAQAKAELGNLRETIHQTLQEMRRFIFDVRPMILDDLGLYPALRRFVDDWNARGNMPVALTLAGAEQRLPRPLELAAFRIVQDAIKIPEGRDTDQPASVQLLLQEPSLRITVETPLLPGHDNRQQPVPAGYHTIQQRATVVGGTAALEARSRVRALKVTVPLSPEAGAKKAG